MAQSVERVDVGVETPRRVMLRERRLNEDARGVEASRRVMLRERRLDADADRAVVARGAELVDVGVEAP